MKDSIIQIMREVSSETGGTLILNIDADTVLLDSGLDSLGFAILVARLEEEFGYDPFTMMEEPSYPHTFGEFLDIYQRFKP